MQHLDLCTSVSHLVDDFDESRARELIPAINDHLRDIRLLLTKSKSLSRDIHYRITPSNERTNKVLSVTSVNLVPIEEVYEKFKDDVNGFWEQPGSAAHVELRRRLACVATFLRSELGASPTQSSRMPNFSLDRLNYAEIRNAGRKYIKIARKLGGLGSLFSLPLDVPYSTYERYLNIDDEATFSHLVSLDLEVERYAKLVKRLILCQIQDDSLTSPYFNLVVDYPECIPDEDYLMLLLHALGGSNVPEALLKDCRLERRRWDAIGEIGKITAAHFGLPDELIRLVSDDGTFQQATVSPHLVQSTVEDGTVAWSLSSEASEYLAKALQPHTVNSLSSLALKIVCFACPPCFEGDTAWSPAFKVAVWKLLEQLVTNAKIPPSLRADVVEAVLYFGERDSTAMRNAAIDSAKKLLRKSLPYHLHATLVVFESILLRNAGDITQSEAIIREFLCRGPKPKTRRDHALRGRLHISEIENKIKSSNEDDDIPSFIYNWAAEQPLSALDTEVTFRLQSTAARFFQSIGDFPAAKASLQSIISLDCTKAIRPNSRRLLAGRLSDAYCEMQQYDQAMEVLQPELDLVKDRDQLRRDFRRLILAWIEVKIGLGDLTEAESILSKSRSTEPAILDDVHNQQLHMRRLFIAARISHTRNDLPEAVSRWKHALEEVEKLQMVKGKGGFTAGVAYVSLAHAQLGVGDEEGARRAWEDGVRVLEWERREFWMPVASTLWVGWIVGEVQRLKGWSVHIR